MATISFLPGRVFRSRDFLKQSSNPTRFASQLVSEGRLKKLQGGLYFVPRTSRWGELPVDLKELLRVWLQGKEGCDWLLTGSPLWNALGLGSTGVAASTLVYNTKRSGSFRLGGHRLQMRKIPFPRRPSAEWFVVDYLNHLGQTDGSREDAVVRLRKALEAGRFNSRRLHEMAVDFGRRGTQAVITEAGSPVSA